MGRFAGRFVGRFVRGFVGRFVGVRGGVRGGSWGFVGGLWDLEFSFVGSEIFGKISASAALSS